MKSIIKPRRDAILKNLPQQFQDSIVAYADGKKQSRVVAWLPKKGIKISQRAVSEFLAWYDTQQELARHSGSVMAILDKIKRNDPTISQKQLQEFGQAFFSELVIRRKDTRGWHLTQDIALK